MTKKSVQETPPRKGRRPGTTNTRDAIITSAKRLFAEHGFHATTLRKIAADANVDVALISHFFGSKDDLFLEVIQVPISAFQSFLDSFNGSENEIGERLIHAYLNIWETPESGAPLLSTIRSTFPRMPPGESLPQNSQAGMFEEFSAHVAELNAKDADARAEIILSMLFGMVIARYVFPPRTLAKIDASEIVNIMGPFIHQMLAPMAENLQSSVKPAAAPLRTIAPVSPRRSAARAPGSLGRASRGRKATDRD